MDHAVTEPMTSLQKVEDALSTVMNTPPADFTQATLLQGLNMVAPLLSLVLPKEADELDGLLLGVAKWALMMRSDHAAQPETIGALFGLEPLTEVGDELQAESAGDEPAEA